MSELKDFESLDSAQQKRQISWWLSVLKTAVQYDKNDFISWSIHRLYHVRAFKELMDFWLDQLLEYTSIFSHLKVRARFLLKWKEINSVEPTLPDILELSVYMKSILPHFDVENFTEKSQQEIPSAKFQIYHQILYLCSYWKENPAQVQVFSGNENYINAFYKAMLEYSQKKKEKHKKEAWKWFTLCLIHNQNQSVVTRLDELFTQRFQEDPTFMAYNKYWKILKYSFDQIEITHITQLPLNITFLLTEMVQLFFLTDLPETSGSSDWKVFYKKTLQDFQQHENISEKDLEWREIQEDCFCLYLVQQPGPLKNCVSSSDFKSYVFKEETVYFVDWCQTPPYQFEEHSSPLDIKKCLHRIWYGQFDPWWSENSEGVIHYRVSDLLTTLLRWIKTGCHWPSTLQQVDLSLVKIPIALPGSMLNNISLAKTPKHVDDVTWLAEYTYPGSTEIQYKIMKPWKMSRQKKYDFIRLAKELFQLPHHIPSRMMVLQRAMDKWLIQESEDDEELDDHEKKIRDKERLKMECKFKIKHGMIGGFQREMWVTNLIGHPGEKDPHKSIDCFALRNGVGGEPLSTKIWPFLAPLEVWKALCWRYIMKMNYTDVSCLLFNAQPAQWLSVHEQSPLINITTLPDKNAEIFSPLETQNSMEALSYYFFTVTPDKELLQLLVQSLQTPSLHNELIYTLEQWKEAILRYNKCHNPNTGQKVKKETGKKRKPVNSLPAEYVPPQKKIKLEKNLTSPRLPSPLFFKRTVSEQKAENEHNKRTSIATRNTRFLNRLLVRIESLHDIILPPFRNP